MKALGTLLALGVGLQLATSPDYDLLLKGGHVIDALDDVQQAHACTVLLREPQRRVEGRVVPRAQVERDEDVLEHRSSPEQAPRQLRACTRGRAFPTPETRRCVHEPGLGTSASGP